MNIAVGEIALQSQGEVALLETDTGVVTHKTSSDTAHLRIGASCSEGEAGASGVAEGEFIADMPELLMTKGAVPIDGCAKVPVAAADVLGLVSAHSGGHVVGVALCAGVVRHGGIHPEIDGLVDAVIAQTVVAIPCMLLTLLHIGVAEEDVKRVAGDGTVDEVSNARC